MISNRTDCNLFNSQGQKYIDIDYSETGTWKYYNSTGKLIKTKFFQ